LQVWAAPELEAPHYVSNVMQLSQKNWRRPRFRLKCG
jgi:hypothetical protein